MKRYCVTGLLGFMVAVGSGASAQAAGESGLLKAPPPCILFVPTLCFEGQGRRHPSYQVFARQVKLPSITITHPGILAIERKVVVAGSRVVRLSLAQRQMIADKFGVSRGVVGNWLQRWHAPGVAPLEILAQDLVTAAIDYQYLRDRWGRYQPPAGMEMVKARALLALQAGDVNAAWAMYLALPRPGTPSF